MLNNKTMSAIFVTLCIGALCSAAKAVVDVEVLKTKMEIYVETSKEIKSDIKEIKEKLDEALAGQI